MKDKSFYPESADLLHAMQWLLKSVDHVPMVSAPNQSDDLRATEKTVLQHVDSLLNSRLPEKGIGEQATLDQLAPMVLHGAAKLGSDTAFAHMDPPTPWITWVTHCWNASLNQNLLHPDVSPVARDLERCLMQWLVPYFGMSGGHLTPGSTVSNLTALWAARDLCGIKRVIASASAHLSVKKAAHILGLELISVPTTPAGQLDESELPANTQDAALVLTAGTTSEGAIDSFSSIGKYAWTHVDAAWAGPLRFSSQHESVLAGIEQADSIAVSAHKWLYQPKECGVLMFRDVASANAVLSIDGAYLAQPNIGLLGSHGATAIPLLATLLAWGRDGLAQRIDAAMKNADSLCEYLREQNNVQVFGDNLCGVVLWRSTEQSAAQIVQSLPFGAASKTTINNVDWVRHVSANPMVNIGLLKREIGQILA